MLITRENILDRFSQNLKWATEIDFATAWTTENRGLYALQDRRPGLKVRAIVGLSGNITEPKALRKLADMGDQLRRADERQRLFHPKVYIFRGTDRRGTDRSVAWIGSANFTGRGFGGNEKLLGNEEVLFETSDTTAVECWFNQLWAQCFPLLKSDINKYEEHRRKNLPRKPSKSWAPAMIEQPPPMRLLDEVDDWRSYVTALERCDRWWKRWSRRRHPENPWSVLEKTNSWRSTIKGLNDDVQRDWRELSDEVQSRLLGLRKDHWALLGRMRGSAKPIVFSRYGEKIQKAIQLVVAADDGDFPDVAIEAYASLVDLPGVGEGIASRLLVLARPDRFVSVNRKSRVGLAKCFGPNMPTALGVPRNYRKLLERIYGRTWFREPAPQDERGQDIWRMRAALLDCFVYDDTGE